VNNNKTVNNRVVNNNVNINKTVVYNKGPQVHEVENVTNKKIVQVNIKNNIKPAPEKIENNKLVIYRPAVKEEPQKKSVPKKAEPYKKP
jgi:hypothetical protein